MSTPGFLDGVERQLLPPDRALDLAADLQREQRMVSDDDAHRLARRARECFADELDLVLVDASVLEGQRPRGVDAEHRDAGKLDERAQGLVDEAAVAGERRQEAAQHVVERNVVVAGNSEHLVTAVAQPLEELARLAELLGPRALGEVAADDDEVGLQLVDLAVDRFDQPLVVGAEMEVGEMDDAGHDRRVSKTRRPCVRFSNSAAAAA